MRAPVAAALLLALAVPAARAETAGPVTRLGAGTEPDVVARADGSALVAWEAGGAPNLRVCRIAPSGEGCAAGSEVSLEGATGSLTSRPFLFALSGGRAVVVHGGCCPQRTFRFNSADDGATFAAGVDFASIVPLDQGAALLGEAVQLLGDPAGGGTVGYQQASAVSGGKVTQEATLDSASGAVSHAVASDGGRPIAAWATSAELAGATSAAGSPNVSGSWSAPVRTAGAAGVRLAGPWATWVRDGRREVARWSAGAFTGAAPLPYAAAGGGDADIALDGAGGVHLAFSPAGSGAVCHAHATADGIWSAPVLLARDTEGVGGLQVSATGPARGRIVFAGPSGVSTVPLGGPGLTPNVCGTAPAALRLTRSPGSPDLRIAVDPQGQDTTWRVEYGPTTAYGSATPDVAIPGTDGPVAAVATPAGLEPGTTYHARLVATNATGTTATEDVTLRVPARLRAVAAADVIRLARRCVRHRARVVVRRRDGAVPVLAEIRPAGRKPVRLGRTKLRNGQSASVRLPRAGGRVRVAVRLADGRVLRRARSFARC